MSKEEAQFDVRILLERISSKTLVTLLRGFFNNPASSLRVVTSKGSITIRINSVTAVELDHFKATGVTEAGSEFEADFYLCWSEVHRWGKIKIAKEVSKT